MLPRAAGADVVLITTDAFLATDGPAFLITGADADKFYASRAGKSGQITTGSILAAGTYELYGNCGVARCGRGG